MENIIREVSVLEKDTIKMSIKELLGLESFNLCDEDIIKKINQARIKEVDEVVFTSGGKTVKIKLNKINPIGLTQGYDDYYSK